MKTLLAILLPLFTGCAFGPVDADPNETENAMSMDLITGPVTMEIMSVNERKIPEDALQAVLERAHTHAKGPIAIAQGVPSKVWIGEDGFVTASQLNGIIVKRKYAGKGTITVVVLPKMATHNRGFYAHLGDGGHLIVLYADKISGFWPFVSNARAWDMVFFHELGHAFGVPWKQDHKWHGNHCTYPTCIMYPKPDFKSVWSTFWNFGLYDDYCEVCRGELKNRGLTE